MGYLKQLRERKLIDDVEKLYDNYNPIHNPININEYFDHIYCLNLDRHSDRWYIMENKFNSLNINAHRFSAVDGDKLRDKVLIKQPKLNKYEIGCKLSHYNIIKDAKKNNYKRILIFEDDVIFTLNFNNLFNEYINKIENWKLFYLGYSQHYWNDIDYLTPNILKSSKIDGTFAYAIDSSIYDDILNTQNILDRPMDNTLFEVQKKYNNRCYMCFPPLVIADIEKSEIRGNLYSKEYIEKLKWNLRDYNI